MRDLIERRTAMTDYTSFHGDPAVKAKYLNRVQAHIAADDLVRGTGWDGSRGCAVGCTLEAYDHALYQTELGIPEWLARLEDELFEGMSVPKSRDWPEVFLAAIPIGVTPDRFEREVKAPFIVFLMDRVRLTFDHARFPDVLTVVDRSRALWLRDDIGSDEWKAAAACAAAGAAGAAAGAAGAAGAAAWAAGAAAWAAGAAAWEAAGAAGAAAWEAAGAACAAAWAAWAAEAAGAAAGAARAAARAAREARAAWAAASAAVFDQYADELLRLLRALNTVNPENQQ